MGRPAAKGKARINSPINTSNQKQMLMAVAGHRR